MVGLFEANMSLACLLFVIEKNGLVDITLSNWNRY